MNDTTAQPIQLTVDDLDSVRNIIALACTRGAFQASEMRIVGSLYERIDAFVNAVQAQARTDAQSEIHPHEGE